MSKITSAMAVLGVVAGLGVAALPLSTYAANERAESAPVTVRTVVNSSLAVTTNDVSTVDLGTVNGSAAGQNTIKVTVSCSVATYNLGVMDEDDNNAMVWKDAADTDQTDATKTVKEIQAITGNTLTSGWGFRKNNANTTAGEWQGVPIYSTTAVNNLVQNGALDNASQDTTVEFGVDINGIANLQNGLYEDDVIFVATAGA